jgi:hypothetical protein
MKYRYIAPAAFLVVAILFFAVYVVGAGGHGSNPFDFIGYLLFPACLITGFLDSFLGGPGLLWMLLCFLLCLVQYFLIGYVIDILLSKRRRGRLSEVSVADPKQ